MTAKPGTTKECVHHWLLSPPLGGRVEGECRNCGEQRAFSSEPARYRSYGRRTSTTQTKKAS
ncbi:MAG: hypothetical protein M0R74_06325 [Dehalococcoidia bacterium]|nr:hypothetical protein [Dehalococcoidia bacterium]